MSKKNECCNIDISSLPFPQECNNNYYRPKSVIKDGKYFRNGKYYGDIIYSDEKYIQIECKNGNKYMEGQIITIEIVG